MFVVSHKKFAIGSVLSDPPGLEFLRRWRRRGRSKSINMVEHLNGTFFSNSHDGFWAAKMSATWWRNGHRILFQLRFLVKQSFPGDCRAYVDTIGHRGTSPLLGGQDQPDVAPSWELPKYTVLNMLLTSWLPRLFPVFQLDVAALSRAW